MTTATQPLPRTAGTGLPHAVRGWFASRRSTRWQAGAADRAPAYAQEPPDASDVPAAGGAAPPPPHEPSVEQLYAYRRLALVRLALLLVDDLPTAEDVVQDAFAAFLRRHGRRPAALDDPEAYLRTCVVNNARSVLRRRRTARAYVPERSRPAPPADTAVLLHEEHRAVLDALKGLTRRQREVLVLRYWSHLSEAQIADCLGLSRGTVKSTASRALDALRRSMGEAT